jgi:hypothetical protein
MEAHKAIEENLQKNGCDIQVRPLNMHKTIFETHFFYNLHVTFEIFSLHSKNILNNVKMNGDADKPDEELH